MVQTHRNLLAGSAPVVKLPVDPAVAELVDHGRERFVDVVRANPESSLCWALLAEGSLNMGTPDGDVAAYAYARTGYHRGLDQLRRNGWKGEGQIPWEHEPNRGFLKALWALAEAAERIGDTEEHERCAQLLRDSSETAYHLLSGNAQETGADQESGADQEAVADDSGADEGSVRDDPGADTPSETDEPDTASSHSGDVAPEAEHAGGEAEFETEETVVVDRAAIRRAGFPHLGQDAADTSTSDHQETGAPEPDHQGADEPDTHQQGTDEPDHQGAGETDSHRQSAGETGDALTGS